MHSFYICVCSLKKGIFSNGFHLFYDRFFMQIGGRQEAFFVSEGLKFQTFSLYRRASSSSKLIYIVKSYWIYLFFYFQVNLIFPYIWELKKAHKSVTLPKISR
jgi:hypothetical protein